MSPETRSEISNTINSLGNLASRYGQIMGSNEPEHYASRLWKQSSTNEPGTYVISVGAGKAETPDQTREVTIWIYGQNKKPREQLSRHSQEIITWLLTDEHGQPYYNKHDSALKQGTAFSGTLGESTDIQIEGKLIEMTQGALHQIQEATQ